jgi:hypothetical protein
MGKARTDKKLEHARERVLEDLRRQFLATMNVGSHILPPIELLALMQELLVAYYWEVFGFEHEEVLGLKLPQPQFRLNVNTKWCQGWATPVRREVYDLNRKRSQ